MPTKGLEFKRTLVILAHLSKLREWLQVLPCFNTNVFIQLRPAFVGVFASIPPRSGLSFSSKVHGKTSQKMISKGKSHRIPAILPVSEQDQRHVEGKPK